MTQIFAFFRRVVRGTRFGRRHGFTMIELLVVIVILGVLATAMVPVVGRFLSVGDDAESRNNLRRLGAAAIAYRSDHDNCYPSAGGVCFEFIWDPVGKRERNYGRSAGWVYFAHSGCPRENNPDDVCDGNPLSQGCGQINSDDGTGCAANRYVNEAGICTCFKATANEGGISPQPSGWYVSGSSSAYAPAEVDIMNGAIYPYMGGDTRAYSNGAFAERAREKLGIAEDKVVRAYAMNVITGADEDIYDVYKQYNKTGGSDGNSAIRYGLASLYPNIDSSRSSTREALPAKTVLFVELDLDDSEVKSSGSLSGDQVWDWDKGNESMGFNHENNGIMEAHVCFADGHVEAIRDPSRDPTSPDTGRRQRLSKWYGSGGLNSSASLE